MSKGYAVIVLRGLQADLKKPQVVKRFNARTLIEAETVFDHHNNLIRWSKSHRDKLGLGPSEDVTLQLYDNTEGFELREEDI